MNSKSMCFAMSRISTCSPQRLDNRFAPNSHVRRYRAALSVHCDLHTGRGHDTTVEAIQVRPRKGNRDVGSPLPLISTVAVHHSHSWAVHFGDDDEGRYAYFKKLDYVSTECIYSPDAYCGHARAFLKDLEAALPSAIIDIIHSGEAFEVKDEVRAMQKTQRMYLTDLSCCC